MKLFIGTELLDRKENTGLDRYTKTLIKLLAEKDGDIGDLCAFSYDNSFGNFPFYKLPGSRKSNAFKSFFGQGISLGVSKDTVVHATTPLPIKTVGKLVVTIHDLGPVLFPELYPIHMSIIFKTNLNYLKKANAFFITNSHNTALELKQYLNISDEQVSVTYLGVDLNRFSNRSQDELRIRDKYNLPPRYFCFTGSLNKRKNLYYALDSYFKYANEAKDPIHFVLAGRYDWGGKSIMKYVRDKFSKLGLIHFPGYIDEEDLPEFYRRSEALVYPSLYEGFGFPPLEALACGTRAIVSQVGALPETVGELGISVDIDDKLNLAQTFEDIEDEKITKPNSISMKDWMKRYSWDIMVNQTLDIYNQL